MRLGPLEYVVGGGESGWWMVRGSHNPQVLISVAREPSCPSSLVGAVGEYCNGWNDPVMSRIDSFASRAKINSYLSEVFDSIQA